MPIIDAEVWKELPEDYQPLLWARLIVDLADDAIGNDSRRHDELLSAALMVASYLVQIRSLDEEVPERESCAKGEAA